ncbi:hypothetical protein NDA01_30505 [Trichocoleus desertorum AS-A10]|uniref:hypothetical protein n=1 Tax=Trichocoleus desertorum TaxID=1481672 RepID=UPI0032999AA5
MEIPLCPVATSILQGDPLTRLSSLAMQHQIGQQGLCSLTGDFYHRAIAVDYGKPSQ